MPLALTLHKCAGMTSKALALAASIAFKQLAGLVQDPGVEHCGRCQDYLSAGKVPSYIVESCPYSCGHSQQLPDALVRDPCSLKVCVLQLQLESREEAGLLGMPTSCCLQVPELRAACKAMGVSAAGEVATHCYWVVKLAGK